MGYNFLVCSLLLLATIDARLVIVETLSTNKKYLYPLMTFPGQPPHVCDYPGGC